MSRRRRQTLPPQAQKLPLEQIYPMLLDRLVDGMLITEAGRKEHLDRDPEVQGRLQAYEDRLIQEAYASRASSSRRRPSDQLKADVTRLRQGQDGPGRGACQPHPRRDRGRGKVDHRRARQGG